MRAGSMEKLVTEQQIAKEARKVAAEKAQESKEANKIPRAGQVAAKVANIRKEEERKTGKVEQHSQRKKATVTQ